MPDVDADDDDGEPNTAPVWLVEHDGRRIAYLCTPTYADMFWRQFTVVPIADVDDAFDPQRWQTGRLTFVSVETGARPPTVLLSPKLPTAIDPTIIARGL